MIEIGTSKLVAVRVRNRRTGKLEAVMDGGKPLQKLKESHVCRITRTVLGGNFGPDRNRKLVVGLVSPDQISFRPQGTRQEVRINIADAYRIAIQRKANIRYLEYARARKAAKQLRNERRRLDAAERRFKPKAKRD